MPNNRLCTFISGKVCLLTLLEDKRQTLPEINIHERLFGTLEYFQQIFVGDLLAHVGYKQFLLFFWIKELSSFQ